MSGIVSIPNGVPGEDMTLLGVTRFAALDAGVGSLEEFIIELLLVVVLVLVVVSMDW
jgi:hypothetical protein